MAKVTLEGELAGGEGTGLVGVRGMVTAVKGTVGTTAQRPEGGSDLAAAGREGRGHRPSWGPSWRGGFH